MIENDQSMPENDRFQALSIDAAAIAREKLKAIFPQCFVEGKLDERKLFEALGSFETIDANDREKYEFRWKGKQDCVKLAGKRSAGTLRPCREDSVDWEGTRNIYIEGDNLEVLKLLQTAYFNKIKMIYVDPPYNTGNDFVYADDFADPLKRYAEVTKQTMKSNPEYMGRFHTNWLNMMYPRLQLARNLLREDGVIFVSIDDNEAHNLRKLCDEVFGEENFVCQFVWERAYAPKNDAKYVSISHDYVLCYAKRMEEFQIGRLERTEESNKLYGNPDNDPRGLWRPDNLSVKSYSAACDYPITCPSGRVVEPPAGRCWSLSKNAFFERLADNRIWFGKDGNNVPSMKRFMSELRHEGLVPQSILFYKEVGHSQEGSKETTALFEAGIFNAPKPLRLLQRLLKLGNVQNDDIVLDFFSGSATTAHAVMQLNAEDNRNRRFIMVQLPEICEEKSEAFKSGYVNICEIGKERIRRAGAKIGAGDVGFRVFKLDCSNFKLWDDSPIKGEDALAILEARLYGMIDIINPERSDEDIVYEVMLKLGQDLCEVIVEIELPRGRKVYGVGEDIRFIVCLTHNVTYDDAQIMSEYAPGRIVFSDGCFVDSSDKTNVKICLRNCGITMRVL